MNDERILDIIEQESIEAAHEEYMDMERLLAVKAICCIC